MEFSVFVDEFFLQGLQVQVAQVVLHALDLVFVVSIVSYLLAHAAASGFPAPRSGGCRSLLSSKVSLSTRPGPAAGSSRRILESSNLLLRSCLTLFNGI